MCVHAAIHGPELKQGKAGNSRTLVYACNIAAFGRVVLALCRTITKIFCHGEPAPAEILKRGIAHAITGRVAGFSA